MPLINFYVIELDETKKVYRLITDLMDLAAFPALTLAQEYHDSLGN